MLQMKSLVSIDFNHNPASAIVDASLTNVIGKKWEKFLLGMTMNGVFQIECVILLNIFIKFLNEIYMKDLEKSIEKKVFY